MVRRVLQQLLFERLKGFAGEKRRAVIDVLIAPGPEADDFFKLRRGQSGRAYSLEDDLIVAFGRRRRGDARVRGNARVCDVVRQAEDDGSARGLRRNQLNSQGV